jgi:hypothetical protein
MLDRQKASAAIWIGGNKIPGPKSTLKGAKAYFILIRNKLFIKDQIVNLSRFQALPVLLTLQHESTRRWHIKK